MVYAMISTMARTNIDIDDELVTRVMEMYDLSSKRDAVDYALKALVGEPIPWADAIAILESSEWVGDLDEMRAGDPPSEPL